MSSSSLSLTASAINSSSSSSLTSLRRTARVRSQPQRYEHEQEHDFVAALDLLGLRQARSQCVRDESDEESDIEPDTERSDSDDDEEIEETTTTGINSTTSSTSSAHSEFKVNWDIPWASPSIKPFIPVPSTSSITDLYEQCDTPLQFFHSILPPAFIDHISTHMNLYAHEYYAREESEKAFTRSEHKREEERKSRWADTTSDEVLSFLGCVLYMSMVNLPSNRDYWNQVTEQQFITRVFSRTRFFHLLHFFHLADNAIEDVEIPSNDATQLRHPLYKINPLIEIVIANSQKYHYPSQHIVIDEAMVGYKGKSKMRQYIASKAQDTGFKVWIAVDCETGYVFNFDVYTGKHHAKIEAGQGSRVVKSLIQPLHVNSWHIICMDNYFTGMKLFKELYDKGFYAIGTIRDVRKEFPEDLKKKRNKELEEGEYKWKQSEELICYTWKDKKLVHFLSTYCDPIQVKVVNRRRNKEKERKEVRCPEVVTEYSRWMRGVDVFAQREAYFRVGRRARKWWPRLAWFIFSIGLTNSYILYTKKEEAKKKVTQREFRFELMKQMIGDYTFRKARGRPRKKQRRLDEVHTPVRMNKQGNCIVCAKPRGERGKHSKRSRYGCKQCDVNVCIECFEKHQELPEEEEDQTETESD
jgi:hypothetical protein